MTELKLEKTIRFISFLWLMHPYGFFFVKHLGWCECLEGDALRCSDGWLLCFGTFLANWPLLACVSECFRVIWGGAWKHVCNERTFLLTIFPELGSGGGGRTLGTHLPGKEPLVLPLAGSAGLWGSLLQGVRPCSWWSEGDMSWALDQQCVLRGHPTSSI